MFFEALMCRKEKKNAACHIAGEYRHPGAHCENIIENMTSNCLPTMIPFLIKIKEERYRD